MKIKKLHKRMFDVIQLKRAEAQLKRATEILAVDCGPEGLQSAVLRGSAGM